MKNARPPLAEPSCAVCVGPADARIGVTAPASARLNRMPACASTVSVCISVEVCELAGASPGRPATSHAPPVADAVGRPAETRGAIFVANCAEGSAIEPTPADLLLILTRAIQTSACRTSAMHSRVNLPRQLRLTRVKPSPPRGRPAASPGPAIFPARSMFTPARSLWPREYLTQSRTAT